MQDVINYWMGMIKVFVEALFTYEILEGVTFGYVIMAVLIMGVVLQFLFTRIIK